MQKSKEKLNHMVIAALLCAIGIMIPMVMPKWVLGPMSITPASHVAIFIAMFISPSTAFAVCIGTTLGFFFTTPFIIAMRAASHIIFATLGALFLKRYPHTIDKPVSSTIFNFVIALIHGIGEVLVVTPFFFAGQQFDAAQLENGFVMSVILLVGGVTVLHSMIDYSISMVIWRPLQSVIGFRKSS